MSQVEQVSEAVIMRNLKKTAKRILWFYGVATLIALLLSTLIIILSYPVNFMISQDVYNALNISQLSVLTVSLLGATSFLVKKLNEIGADELQSEKTTLLASVVLFTTAFTVRIILTVMQMSGLFSL